MSKKLEGRQVIGPDVEEGPLPEKTDDRTWRLLLLMLATVLMMVGMFIMAGGTDRGTPARVMLTASGCEFAKLAGASIGDEKAGSCTVRGLFREHVFGDGAILDQGNGKRLRFGTAAIVGHVRDESIDAPLGKDQELQVWAGGGVLVLALAAIIVAALPRRVG